MSRYSYAGPFKNPAENLAPWEDPETGLFHVGVYRDCDCGCPNCKGRFLVRRSENDEGTDDVSEIYDAIDGEREFFEEDYDHYLEENGPEIARMEAYEAWRNEY